jgi:atypical dual specificity phosphatase
LPAPAAFAPAAPEPEVYEAGPDILSAEPAAERMSVPVPFAPGAAKSALIDMGEDFNAEPVQRAAPPAFDDLPPISLSPQMMQAVPLPPRAAASQMVPPLDPQRHERAAVTRYPGSGAPGPRGFVWIEDGRLAATPMPGISANIDQDLDLLKQAGITVLITLTEQDFPQHTLFQHGLRNLHFPIADRKAPSTADTDVLVNQMHDMLNHGEVLAVHCLAGLGRTGTILAAYMVKEKGISAQVALNQIRHFNRQFVQTDDQEDFLMEYEVQQEQTVLRNRAAEGGTFL